MISDADHEEIERSVDQLDVDSWRPLDDHERDLLRRVFGATPIGDRDQAS